MQNFCVYLIEHSSHVTNFLQNAILDWLTIMQTNHTDPDVDGPEEGLEISTRLLHAFAKSAEEFSRELDRNRLYLKWGTHWGRAHWLD